MQADDPTSATTRGPSRDDSASIPDPAGRAEGGPLAAELAREIRRRRIEAGLSHAQLANRVGYSRQYISIAERPGKGLPSADLVRALDRALAAAGSLTALHEQANLEKRRRRASDRPISPKDTEFRPDDQSPRVDSHDSVMAAVQGSMSLLGAVGEGDLDSLMVADLEDRIETLVSHYFQIDPTTFLAEATRLRNRVSNLANCTTGSSRRRRLLAALARLTAVMAAGSFAAGGPTDPHCCAALALAQRAEHSALEAWIRATQAQIALHTGNPLAACRYARAGMKVAPIGSTSLVRSASYLARANARLGNRREALTAWDTAMRTWDRLDSPSPESVLSLSSDYPIYFELTMRTWLGDSATAKTLADRHDNPAAQTVSQVVSQVDVALLRIVDREIDEAARCGEHALTIGATRLTPTVRDRITELVGALTPFHRASTQALAERWTWISA